MKSSRELVYDTLEFKNTGDRIPRQMWYLPWAVKRYSKQIEKIRTEYPDDIVEVAQEFRQYGVFPIVEGDRYSEGHFIDEWGCRFENIYEGIHGEVKQPLVPVDDDEWKDTSRIHIPEELLTFDKEKVNHFCRDTDKFVLQSGELARPFERMQFIRGTENMLADFAIKPPKMFEILDKVHNFYIRLLTAWAQTDIDGLFFMDDWGTQKNLLVNPDFWRRTIMPMYREYSDIAKKYGKKIFFHSDGFTLDIIPHLIDIGIDAVNLQIFCIGLENLRQFKGKITFWGEIDRQFILPEGTKKDVEEAVGKVKDCLWMNGGVIAQCEFGPGANPDNVGSVFEAWNNISL